MSSILFPFPTPLTGRQYFYILIVQGLVAALIDAGANFGIAYAMYHSQATVRMWVFSQNTIAGDLGVTPLIQTAISMIISSGLIHSDLHHHAVRPLPFVWPHVEDLPDPRQVLDRFEKKKDSAKKQKASEASTPEEKSVESETSSRYRFSYYPLMLIRFIFEGTENNMLFDWHGPRTFLKRFILTGIQGLGLGVVFGLPLWCLAIVILGPIYGTGNMGNKWAPQAIKLVYGFLAGLITNPIIALLALGSQAEHHLVYLDVEENLEAPVTDRTQITPPVTPRPAFRPQSSTAQSSTRMLPRGRRSSSTLTANVTMLQPAPRLPLSPLGPLVPIPQANTITSPRSQIPPYSPMTTPKRPRALTASSTGTGSFYLGGTGGRAQRPRARDRALTVSHTGTRQDGVVLEVEAGGRDEILQDDGAMRPPPPGRGRSATTSNATPLRTGTDATMAGYFGRTDVPLTPTRQGQSGLTKTMLSESRESVL